MSRPYRICVVCWGNICRSPMAEFMFRAAFDEEGLGDEVEIDSAGTSAEERGNPMDRRARSALSRRGVPDSGWASHRARRFTHSWFDDYDLIVAADGVHDEILRRLARSSDDAEKIRLLRSFDERAVESGNLAMADPWYGDDASFDRTFEQIEASTAGLVEFVRGQIDHPPSASQSDRRSRPTRRRGGSART